ncbi:MAG: COG1361 S-layer family protein, partial [Candidatus Woesearchaeota archaeon]
KVPGKELVQQFGSLEAYQNDDKMKVVEFVVRVDKDASEGEYDLKVKEYASQNEANAIEASLPIKVSSSESAEVIYIDKVQLIPGKETDMQFTINNVGSSPLQKLTFSWDNEDDIILPVGSDDTKYIDYIGVGESAELHYTVIADTNADPGLYKLNLHLTYSDTSNGTESEISTSAGVYVGGETDFDVAFSETSNGETSFTVANIGSSPAYSVSVSVPEQDSWETTGSSSSIIGNLNNGDYTVVSFTLGQIGSGSEIELLIKYTDPQGGRQEVTKIVKMNSNSSISSFGIGTANNPQMSGQPGGMASGFQTLIIIGKYTLIIILVVIAGIVGFLWYKKRHKLGQIKTQNM